MNKNKFNEIFEINKFNKIILLAIVGFILFKFFSYDHYPVVDELNSIALLSSFKTSLIKFGGHNHMLSTQIGNIIIFIFDVDIMKIRLLSVMSTILTIYIIQKYLNNYLKTYIFVILYLSIDVIITYFSLYRGYAISSMLFSVIFFLILDEKNKLKNYKIIYLLLSILILHNQSTLYIVIPILIGITINLPRNGIKFQFISYKIFLLYFCFPAATLIFFMCLVEGIYTEKIFIKLSNFNNFYLIIFKNLFTITFAGFHNIFFNDFVSITLTETFDDFLEKIKNNLLFFTIFFISLIKSAYFIFIKKNKDPINIIVLIFFIIFLIINRNAPVRVYTGFVSFFIIYLFYDVNFSLFKNHKNISQIPLFIILPLIIFLKLYNIDFIKIQAPEINDLSNDIELLQKRRVDCNFPSRKYSKELDKHLEYYVYLNKCKKKPDINKYYKYYKS